MKKNLLPFQSGLPLTRDTKTFLTALPSLKAFLFTKELSKPSVVGEFSRLSLMLIKEFYKQKMFMGVLDSRKKTMRFIETNLR